MEASLFFDPLKCVDCRICELVCSFENQSGFNPRYSFIKILINPDTGMNRVHLSRECTGCCSCERNCPTHALQFSPDLQKILESGDTGHFVKRESK